MPKLLKSVNFSRSCVITLSSKEQIPGGFCRPLIAFNAEQQNLEQ